jgi:hypothetical protein
MLGTLETLEDTGAYAELTPAIFVKPGPSSVAPTIRADGARSRHEAVLSRADGAGRLRRKLQNGRRDECSRNVKRPRQAPARSLLRFPSAHFPQRRLFWTARILRLHVALDEFYRPVECTGSKSTWGLPLAHHMEHTRRALSKNWISGRCHH